MDDNKKSFLLYVDAKDIFDQISDELAGQLIKHIFKYVNDENPVSENAMLNLAFTSIKSQLKRDLRKYKTICERNKANGSKGGRPKKPSGLSGNPKKPKKPDTDNDTDNDTDTDTDNDMKNKNIPSISDFLIYCESKNKDYPRMVDSLKLKYESWKANNWKDGNDSEIKNWKTKILNTMPYIPLRDIPKPKVRKYAVNMGDRITYFTKEIFESRFKCGGYTIDLNDFKDE